MIKKRLTEKLNKHFSGYKWKPDELSSNNRGKYQDIYSWEGFVTNDLGIRKFVGSYQTMTELCKCDRYVLNKDGELFGIKETKK